MADGRVKFEQPFQATPWMSPAHGRWQILPPDNVLKVRFNWRGDETRRMVEPTFVQVHCGDVDAYAATGEDTFTGLMLLPWITAFEMRNQASRASGSALGPVRDSAEETHDMWVAEIETLAHLPR